MPKILKVIADIIVMTGFICSVLGYYENQEIIWIIYMIFQLPYLIMRIVEILRLKENTHA